MIKESELSKISYLRRPKGDDRAIPLIPCHLRDDNWELWMAGANGVLLPLTTWPVEGCYLADAPASNEDAFLHLLDIAVKHLHYPDIMNRIQMILDDIQNMSVSIAKLDLFFRCWKNDPQSINARFVSTELEYLVSTSRQVFDLLHKIVVAVLKRSRYLDPSKGVLTALPDGSFAKVVLHGNEVRTLEQIQAKWNVPEAVAAFYVSQSDFFKWMRGFRNEIEHHGRNTGIVFMTENGFAISTNSPPYKNLNFWNESNCIGPNGVGSVRSFVGYLISRTLIGLEDFGQVLMTIELPPDMIPNHRVWLRGSHVNALKEMEAWIHEKPWFE